MQQMAASVAPSFVAPPAQHQQQANLHQMAGQFVQGLSPHQMAALRQQQHNQQKAFNPFIAAALNQQQQQQQQNYVQQPQMAASFQQPRIMNGAQSQMGVMQQQQHPQQHHNIQQQLHQQYNPMASHQQHQHPQMQHQAMIQQQQQQHVQHPHQHPQHAQQFIPSSPISMAESSVRQNIVPAPTVAAAAADAISESVGAASEPVHDVVVPAASSTSTAVIQATSGIPAPAGLGSSSPVNSNSNGGAQSTSWPLQAPDVPKITNLEVKCEKNLMKVSIEFDKMFNGVIFSKGHYSQGQCVHVGQNSGKQQAYFDISINSCGTQGNTQNGLYGMGGNTGSGTYFENTIVIQYDPNVQEVYDHARKLRCTWHDQYEKAVTFRPFPVDMLDIVRADFAGDNVGCWMQIQVGKGKFRTLFCNLIFSV